jgi:hypothetical protein
VKPPATWASSPKPVLVRRITDAMNGMMSPRVAFAIAFIVKNPRATTALKANQP